MAKCRAKNYDFQAGDVIINYKGQILLVVMIDNSQYNIMFAQMDEPVVSMTKADRNLRFKNQAAIEEFLQKERDEHGEYIVRYIPADRVVFDEALD